MFLFFPQNEHIYAVPGKVIVDDCLDIRKAAFQCMDTLLDSYPNNIDVSIFMNHVMIGLNDHFEIKILTCSIIIKLVNLRPDVVIASKLQ